MGMPKPCSLHTLSGPLRSLPGNSKQGLRCKTCKVSVHLWCSEEISHQQCAGKTVSGDHMETAGCKSPQDWHVG